MKYIIILAAAIIAGYSSFSQNNETVKEKSAIIQLAEDEIRAFCMGDVEGLEEKWVQKNTSQKIVNTRNHCTLLDSWSEIYLNYIDSMCLGKIQRMDVSTSNYKINLYHNTALVHHDIIWGAGEKQITQKRVAHLVKVDGEWKFDFATHIHSLKSQQLSDN